MTTANPYTSGEHHGLAYPGPAAPGGAAPAGVIEPPYCSYDYMRQNGMYHHQFPPQQQHHQPFDPYNHRSAYRDTSMKQEPHDDGYETSGDLEIRAQGDGQKLYNAMQASLNIKQEPTHDPYSFVDEEVAAASQNRGPPVPGLPVPMPKKRGRKKKLKPGEEGMTEEEEPALKKKIKEEKTVKERKKHDRFNGMPEEEVSKRTLPDHLTENLDIIIIGINPGLFAAYKGHHYAGPGNHFWKCLYLSGLTPEPMTSDDDYKLMQYGVGFTNMVARATKGSADLTRKEIKEGCQILLEKVKKYKPKIAVFNGKLIYEVFSGKKDFPFGRQAEFVEGTSTYMWVMPSSSARCAQLPRAADKVPFYAALKKFRDYLNGIISELDDSEVVFNDPKLRNITENGETKEDCKEGFQGYGRLPNNGDLTDLSNAKKGEGGEVVKKKRGRPKKIKGEDGAEAPPPKPRPPKPPASSVNGDTPKKKRGRPKKVKDGEQVAPPPPQQQPPQQMQQHNGMVVPMNNCFSPPPNTFHPNQFNQYNQPQNMYQQQQQPQQQQHSPNSAQYQHQSPPLAHRYNSQSPRPSSQQPFTHSDLSSEISAAISSEHNLGSPPPTSPSLGPPDFEPPTSMPEENKEVTEAPGVNTVPFSSPTPPSSNSASQDLQTQLPQQQQGQQQPQQQYPGQYPCSGVVNTPASTPQDVASKSLSGLESLVDQIPSITDNPNPDTPSSVGGGGGAFEPVGGYDEGGTPYASYPAAYPAYSAAASTNYNSFSVSSLANSSAASGGGSTAAPDLNSPFSVSSLASNYNPHHHPGANSQGYPNLMGGHMMGNQGMFGAPPMPYPYGQYPTAASGYPYSPSTIHMPSPNYPYPYNNNPYHHHQPPASGYLQNHMLDRIKQDRMDIGFGGF
ncbi:uncharacterized protein LOC132205822 isoform X2 [Neocloeon triangulifer]|uniref:uncharacterized protein LOC132205822 isoform X2 n=1 Tax=Neocloeon triangulifer TaxID=2078957 RepID=UPI00286EBCAC|nr:uncharacterized protein LOC132205822 isoform X2 [Neocloeon triangulifer]